MRINEIAFPRRQRIYVEAAGIAIMGQSADVLIPTSVEDLLINKRNQAHV